MFDKIKNQLDEVDLMNSAKMPPQGEPALLSKYSSNLPKT